MGSFIFTLLLIGGAFYFLFVHRFYGPGGVEYKGWLAKHKGEASAEPASSNSNTAHSTVAPKGNAAVRLVNIGSNKLGIVKVLVDTTTLGLKSAKDAADAAPIIFIDGLADDEASYIVSQINTFGGKAEVVKGGKADSSLPKAQAKEPVTEDDDVVPEGYFNNDTNDTFDSNDEDEVDDSENSVGLNNESTISDFQRVLDEAKTDLFGIAWENMKEYYGWLLIGASRQHDININSDTIWQIMSDGYEQSRQALIEHYKEGIAKVENDKDSLRVMPDWFANIYLLNGFNPFSINAHQYFDAQTWDAIGERINKWSEDIYKARTAVPEGRDKQFYDEPNAAEYLVRLFTILQGEVDSKIDVNREMFKRKYHFIFDLPEIKK